MGSGEYAIDHSSFICHGRHRQDQPLWQISDAFAGRRAPALDETGYTWRQPDAAIFQMTIYGRYAGAPRGKVSYRRVFTGILADREILAVIAFVKARWPIGLRVAQAMLNPGFAGMPAGANTTGWRLPPNCNGVLGRGEFWAQPP